MTILVPLHNFFTVTAPYTRCLVGNSGCSTSDIAVCEQLYISSLINASISCMIQAHLCELMWKCGSSIVISYVSRFCTDPVHSIVIMLLQRPNNDCH